MYVVEEFKLILPLNLTYPLTAEPAFDFNSYVMGKEYMLSLLSAILVLCNCVENYKLFRANLNRIFSLRSTKCLNIFQYVC